LPIGNELKVAIELTKNRLIDDLISREVVLLWDIDGTLLSTNGIGLEHLTDAFYELTGKELHSNYQNNHGLTDYEIVLNCLSRNKNPDPQQISLANEVVEKYVQKYEKSNNLQQIRRFGTFNSSFFESLSNMGFLNRIVTGNCLSGAKLKLKQTNLISFFNLDESFFSNALDWNRDAIVKRAAKHFELSNAIIIGDTFRDYSVAKSNGLQSIILNWKHDSDVSSLVDSEYVRVFEEDNILNGDFLSYLINLIKRIE
jgi:phosphoglycolate phosphatase-like HAD superfamily hydrolase